MKDLDLVDVDLNRVDMSGADLRGAILEGATLSVSDLFMTGIEIESMQEMGEFIEYLYHVNPHLCNLRPK